MTFFDVCVLVLIVGSILGVAVLMYAQPSDRRSEAMPLSHLPECTANLCVCPKPKPTVRAVVIGLLPMIVLIGAGIYRCPMSWV